MEKIKVDRGAATREKLVAAALDEFGKRGFEGAGARDITAAAGVPLSSIPYHFGTKDALYRAVLEHVSARLGDALRPAVDEALQAIHASPPEAAAALVAFQAALVRVLAADPEAESWAKILLREHLDPSPAFDLVYNDAGGRAVDLIAGLVGRASGRAPGDEAVILEAFARMGEALVFRIVQQAVKRRLDWPEFGERQAERVAAAVSNMHAVASR